MENVYSSKESHQGLPSGRSAFAQSMERGSLRSRGTSLGKAICVAAAVFLAAGLGTFPAFGDTNPSFVRFAYGFPGGGSGRVVSGPPVAEGITFSGLSLHNVSEGGFIPGVGTPFGPWPTALAAGWPNNPSDPYMSFTIFAPSGYTVDVDRGSLSAPTIQGFPSFNVSGPGASEEIKVGFVHSPAVGGQLPLSGMSGQLTVVPEPSTVLGGIAAAGSILGFFARRFRRGNSPPEVA
jgi:hypothetical protein